MTIAINLTNFIKAGNGEFLLDYFLKFTISQPRNQFVFITSFAIDPQRFNSNNIRQVISAPRANNPLMWKIWLDFTLPGIAKKNKAEVIIHTGGVCSLRTKICQYLFISNLSFLTAPQYFSTKEVHFLKRKMPAFLKKATTIVTASNFLSMEIEKLYSVNSEKIKRFQMLPGDIYQPLNWKEKEAIKELYAEGKEYFLFSGEIHSGNNLVNLLKAFSFFKKRQKSNMQLIIAFKSVSGKDPFIENFKLYKYRDEVKLLGNLPERDLANITAAAYAFLYPTMYDSMPIHSIQAMQCEVPVITTHSSNQYEIFGDAVLYADPANSEDIGDKMMLVFKDEAKRTELIKRGISKIQENSAGNPVNQWWQTVP